MVRLWGAGLLIALGGCTSTPAPTPAPVAVLAQPVNVRPEAISIQGPMGLHPELMQAFDEQQQRGEMVAPARAAERLASYYRWHGWQNVEVRPPSVQGDGTLLLTVDATAPGPYPELPAPTAILRENELLSGSGRLLAQLDSDLQPWLDSDSRILVDVEGRRLLFKDWQSGIIEFPVAVGGPGRTTPSGTYTVENVTRYPTWYPPESLRRHYRKRGRELPKAVPPGESNPLGSRFIKLQRGLGIHGTNQPNSIGRAVSWGCIRMHDPDVKRLAEHLSAGDRVTIVRQRRQLASLIDSGHEREILQ